jgi:C_GCAxxG_C_C family probable redox protein
MESSGPNAEGGTCRQELEREAFDYFNGGFCCSEAISKTLIDHFAEDPAGYPVKAASGFCGGVGRTHEDVCGALAGGIIAVGYLMGRMEKGGDIGEACRVITEFRDAFIEAFGSTNCEQILIRFGQQENKFQCKQLTGRATGMLADILAKRLPQASRKG